MSVALQDLGCRLSRPKAESIERALLDFSWHIGVCSDRARHFADPELVARLLEAMAIASHLGDKDRQLVPEGGRLGVDAVRPTDRQGVLVAHVQLRQDG